MATDKLTEGREKYWSEIDDTRRIERMRQEVRHLKSQNRQLIESVRSLLKHTHKDNTPPLVEIEPAYGSQLSGGGLIQVGAIGDDVYF